MDSKRHLLMARKLSNEGSHVWRLRKRTRESDGVTSASDRVYKLKILLPNGMVVLVKISEGQESVTIRELANLAKQQCDIATQAEQASNPKKSVRWDADLRFIDDYDHIFKTSFKLTRLDTNRVYNLRLDDGSQPATIYENMWEITSNTELLTKLPEEYTFEMALADLIDTSLQAVYANDEYDRRLISVEVLNDKISIFDSGPGMNSLSIEKWGKMGASLNRAYETQTIGGKPPYLTPRFGMFGYGGIIASMHLGRRVEVSCKTKIGKKVFMLRLERDALTSASVSSSKGSWRTYGGLREPTNEELILSPVGSFTKVEIFEPDMRCTNIKRLKCKLKDIYYPYIQCDDLPQKGRTIMPLKFQVNGDDLAEITSWEVAYTNLATCIVPEFVLEVRFKLNHTMASSQGSSEEANARLRCVYLPIQKGKESIERVLDALKEDGYDCTEEFESFRHVSCRWLGRLLPDACWEWLPFMDLRQRNTDGSQVFLNRSCMRVKCLIDTDAGFSPTPSKTDFAPQNPFTTALMNLGRKQPLEKDSGVDIDIRRDGKSMSLKQLDKKYKLWLRNMHERYDEDEETPTIKEWQIEKRQSRISSEVMIELPLETEPKNISHNLNAVSGLNSETPLDHRSSEYHTPKTLDRCPDTARQQEADVEYFYQLEKDLWDEILETGLRIGKVEREIKMLEDEQKTIEAQVSKCEGIRGNGAVSLGCLENGIDFPVVPAKNQLSQDVTRVLNQNVELKLGEKRKYHASVLKSFYKQRDVYVKHLTQLPHVKRNF